jgi:hypothetical protein
MASQESLLAMETVLALKGNFPRQFLGVASLQFFHNNWLHGTYKMHVRARIVSPTSENLARKKDPQIHKVLR